ncbi:hypothetical protein [Clostridium sporogenes]|uniref:Uncharacterized protein n=1 Tax=Clostridium sporogenes TaxID=1509 RepID=A0ABX4K0Z9_CLOSG|nr:hypothetical protein [Clostridium sporogenes]PHG98850.1 hypothetical protein CRX47_02960 [Clostridium sporogenes]
MAYGKGNLGGKSKLKFWETPLNFTQTVNIDYADTSQPNCRFAYKDLTIYQRYNETDLNIYYKSLLIKQQEIGINLGSTFSQIYVDDDYNIYILTTSKLFSFYFQKNIIKSMNYNLTLLHPLEIVILNLIILYIL